MSAVADPTPIGIIAGTGQLPVAVADALRHAGRPVVVAQMAGFPVETPPEYPVIDFRPEKLGALFRALKAEGVHEIVFAGAVQRPSMDLTQLDFKTLILAPRLLTALRRGDDGTLRTVLAIFEDQGFVIRAAHDIVPNLLPSAGVLTNRQPDQSDLEDAARAASIVASLADADVGQGAVVAQGVALALEAAPGTDRMLEYVCDRAGGWRPQADGPGGVLFKGPKPRQDRRVDLPVIGPKTIRLAAKAGLSGVAIEADGVMLINAPEAVAAADDAGLFIWVRPKDGE